jgi:hypothetical protein
MADRKATFAKRQRETELKDRAREKEARRVARRSNPKEGKGPEIAWDEAVHATESAPVDRSVSLNPTDDSSAPPPAPAAPAPVDPRSLQGNQGGGSSGSSSSGSGQGSSGSSGPTTP